jgi:hypothetical protein
MLPFVWRALPQATQKVLLQKVLVNPFQGGFFRLRRTIDVPSAFIAHGIQISICRLF